MKKTYEQSAKELTLMLIYLMREQDQYQKHQEHSWNGYNFQVLRELEEDELLWQPRNRRGYSKDVYLTCDGREKAIQLLQEYECSDYPVNERFEFREIRPSEIEEAIEIEQICFPPHEACSPESMRDRVKVAPDLFLVAIDKESGKMAGFLNGIATDEEKFHDDFFTDASLHQPKGKKIMLLGLDVVPEFRKQGLAHELMYQYLRKEEKRDEVVLTCLEEKVKFYKGMGFTDLGLSASTWGDEQWHEMVYEIQKAR